MLLLKYYYVFILPLLCKVHAEEPSSTLGYFGTSYVRDQTSSATLDNTSSQPRYIPAHSLTVSRPVTIDFQPGRLQPTTVPLTIIPSSIEAPGATLPSVPSTNQALPASTDTTTSGQSMFPNQPWQTQMPPSPNIETPTHTQIINTSLIIVYPATSAKPPIASFILNHSVAGSEYNLTIVSAHQPSSTLQPLLSIGTSFPYPSITPSISTPLPSVVTVSAPPEVLVTAPSQTTTSPTFPITTPTSIQSPSLTELENLNESESHSPNVTFGTEQTNPVREQGTLPPTFPTIQTSKFEQESSTTSEDTEGNTLSQSSNNPEQNPETSHEPVTILSDPTAQPIPSSESKLQPTPEGASTAEGDPLSTSQPMYSTSQATSIPNQPQPSFQSPPPIGIQYENRPVAPQTIPTTLQPVPINSQPNFYPDSQPQSTTVSSPVSPVPGTFASTNSMNEQQPSSPTITAPLYAIKIDFFCQASNSYYPITNECDTYVECKQGVAMKQFCPDGLHFKASTQWPDYPCAYPTEVQCSETSISQTPNPAPNCPHQYGFYPLKDNNCSYYIMCHEGKATIMRCPYGLAFNFNKNSCDWPENVPSCNVDAFRGFTCPPPPLKSDGSFSDIMIKYRFKNSCKSYIVCQRGYPRLLSCDPGLSFQQTTQTCVDSRLVSCDSNL